jgi:hypothetical protein
MSGDEVVFQSKAPRTVKIHARGEDFRIVQLVGNLLVYSKALNHTTT